ncbi:MAG TPA: hypothetical protein ENG86_07160 [Nitrospirae bacterium]|nr:hypothetical protein [Nitrospirota bacterium]
MSKKIRYLFPVLLIFMISLYFLPADDIAGATGAMTQEKARTTLSAIMPDVKIISVEKAAVKGLWEVAIQSRGRKGIVYLDNAGKRAIFGSIIDIATRTNITKKKFDDINRVDVSQIPLDDALILGNKNAKHRVIVFDDPD